MEFPKLSVDRIRHGIKKHGDSQRLVEEDIVFGRWRWCDEREGSLVDVVAAWQRVHALQPHAEVVHEDASASSK